jgi:malate dehydrogenase (oxaloacetate-decarboxylating)
MKVAAAYAIANSIPVTEITEDNIIPKAFDPNVKANVANAVKEAAIKSGVSRLK